MVSSQRSLEILIFCFCQNPLNVRGSPSARSSVARTALLRPLLPNIPRQSSKVGLGHRRTNRHRSGPARRTPERGGGKNRPRAPRKSLPSWPAERRGGIRGLRLAGRRG